MNPLNDILSQVAAELRVLELSSNQLQSTLTEAFLASATGVEAVSDMQRLDFLSQALGALSAFMDALASSAPTHWVLDAGTAASSLKLAALAERLSGRGGAEPEAPDQSPGELDLFN